MKYGVYEVGDNSLGLSMAEQKLLIACIHMAAQEGFYRFQWEGVVGSDSNVVSVLVKLGFTEHDARRLIEYT